MAEKELLNLMNPGYLGVRFRAVLPATGLPAAFGIVTACNPNGEAISSQENKHATDRLRAALEEEGHFFFSVTGGSPDFSHSEPGFGVLFRSMKEAIAWGNRYQQEAVFWVENGDVHLVPCDGSDSLKIGQWQTLAEPDAHLFAERPEAGKSSII